MKLPRVPHSQADNNQELICHHVGVAHHHIHSPSTTIAITSASSPLPWALRSVFAASVHQQSIGSDYSQCHVPFLAHTYPTISEYSRFHLCASKLATRLSACLVSRPAMPSTEYMSGVKSLRCSRHGARCLAFFSFSHLSRTF